MPETNVFWDPLSDTILQERDETGTVTAEYTTEPGLYGNLVSQDRGGAESQYHFDALGSTLALSDENQQVTDTYAYGTFGEVSEHTGSTVNPFQYVGQKGYYKDEVTGEYFVRRRSFSARIGRWLSQDPFTFIDLRLPLQRHSHSFRRLFNYLRSLELLRGILGFTSSFHAYSFVRSNPVNYRDPSGMIECRDDICGPEVIEAGDLEGFVIVDASYDKQPDDPDLRNMTVDGVLEHIGAFVKLNDKKWLSGCGPDGKGTRVWMSAFIHLECVLWEKDKPGIRCLPPGQPTWQLDSVRFYLQPTSTPFSDFAGTSARPVAGDERIEFKGYGVAVMCLCPNGIEFVEKPLAEFYYVMAHWQRKEWAVVTFQQFSGGSLDWSALAWPPGVPGRRGLAVPDCC